MCVRFEDEVPLGFGSRQQDTFLLWEHLDVREGLCVNVRVSANVHFV